MQDILVLIAQNLNLEIKEKLDYFCTYKNIALEFFLQSSKL